MSINKLNQTIIESFEKRRLHAFNKINTLIPLSHRVGRFLDIGCGTGNGMIAAIQNGYELAVGVDRSFSEFKWFSFDIYEELVRSYNLDPWRILPVEADIFSLKFPKNSFDCVMMLDSIEHVPNPYEFLKVAAEYVKPGGYFIIDTCPLYFSKVGHHLWNHVPPELPWAHLRYDFLALIDEFSIDKWSIDRFEELNKVTHDDIRSAILDFNLSIEKEHRAIASPEDVELLKNVRHELNLINVPEHALFENWIMLLAKKKI
jgi:SAM-dependent methyltransferase